SDAFGAAELFLQSCAFGNVAKDDGKELVAFDCDMRDGGFDRKFFPVRSKTGYGTELAHLAAGNARLSESLHMLTVGLTETTRDKPIERLINGVLEGALEHTLGRVIKYDNLLLMIDSNDGIHRGLDDAFESELADQILLLCSLSASHRSFDC